jgi:hypothetical protein
MPTQICRYIHTTGARCGSPALRNKVFCYHHIRITAHHQPLTAHDADDMPTIIHPIPKDHLDRMQREPILAEYYSGTIRANRRAAQLNLAIPPLEDADSIQIALSMLITAMAQNRIDTKRATGMLYGLQVASNHAAHRAFAPSRSSLVTETTLDEAGLELAPDVDPDSEIEYQQLLEAFAIEQAKEPTQEELDAACEEREEARVVGRHRFCV